MRDQQAGFIFIFTLCTILVISLLLVSSMQQLVLYSKAINRQELHHQLFYQLEDAMKYVLKNALKNTACELTTSDADNALNKLSHGMGCSFAFGGREYRYFYEYLGAFPCLVVSENEHTFETHHIRVTLMQQDAVSSVLQVRYLNKGIVSSCSKELHKVFIGISSWRYFADYRT